MGSVEDDELEPCPSSPSMPVFRFPSRKEQSSSIRSGRNSSRLLLDRTGADSEPLSSKCFLHWYRATCDRTASRLDAPLASLGFAMFIKVGAG